MATFQLLAVQLLAMLAIQLMMPLSSVQTGSFLEKDGQCNIFHPTLCITEAMAQVGTLLT
jgi:hypothetical protein